jgi:SAM-dependent methyltransferase
MGQLARTVKGAVTVARRRGVGYFGYLAAGVVWPRATYRFVWGPDAPSVLRHAFHLAGAIGVRAATARDLSERGLLAGNAAAEATVTPGEIEALMDRAHAAGVTGVAGGFDRAARAADGTVRFTQLPGARLHLRRGAHFHAGRDADRRAFNARFGASILTEREARRAIAALRAAIRNAYRDYAPIDFGGGLTFGQIASTDSGTGRWEFFNGRVVAPLVAGRRVLDLGSNNGSLPLMMLRAGAREVVAVEANPAIAEFARLNGRILAWRDLTRYRLEVLTDDMRVLLARDLGRFDVVTAFCSLYYLPRADMAAVVRKAAEMGATLVLQANEAIGDLPARTDVLARLMRENGYPHVDVHAPRGYARPLLVGRAVTAAPADDRVRELSVA